MVEINTIPDIVYAKGPKAKIRPSGKCDIYYEQKLKEVFYQAADNHEGTIYDKQCWNLLMDLIRRTKLGTLEDTQRIEKVCPAFPVKFSTFIQTV